MPQRCLLTGQMVSQGRTWHPSLRHCSELLLATDEAKRRPEEGMSEAFVGFQFAARSASRLLLMINWV